MDSKDRHKRLKTITRQILSWYKQHERDLPWRKTRDPYHIWVSEVMLQQTQVDTVIPYYHDFLSRFPSVQALADASLDSVLKAWENMGYYTRARNLHAAAKEIVVRLEGNLPDTLDDLLDLPGIGNYTAGAILSIAFEKPVPAVDGNVRRVLSRLFAIEQPVDRGRVQKQIIDLAQDMVPKKEAGRFNQALMDLGSEICTPRRPNCTACPIQGSCEAFNRGLQDILPIARKRGPLPHRNVTAGIVQDEQGRVLIVRRPKRGLLGGLWKFPGGPRNSDQSLKSALRKSVSEELGIKVKVGKSMTSVNHTYTHFRMTLHAFQCTHEKGSPKTLACDSWKWVKPSRLADFAFSKADREVIKAVLLEE